MRHAEKLQFGVTHDQPFTIPFFFGGGGGGAGVGKVGVRVGDGQRDLKKEREKKKIVSQTKREEGPRDC